MSVSVMTVAIGSGSAMAVPAMTAAAVVCARHRQVLSSLRRLNYSGVPVLRARCVGMPDRCSPEGRPVAVTPMTVLRVRRSCVDNRLMGTVGGIGRRKGVLSHCASMMCWLVVRGVDNDVVIAWSLVVIICGAGGLCKIKCGRSGE